MSEIERFIKFIPSEESQWLLLNHGNAFVLLALIATRARRYNGHPDGLIIGDVLIGSSDLEPGMSRQNFRTALNKLVEYGYVEIIANGKTFLKREKSTIKVTIKGMLVNLVKSTIYDINPESSNQHINQRLTNDQPTTNHKQERKRKDISNDISKEEQAHPAEQVRSKDLLTFNFDNWKFEGYTEQDAADWRLMYPHIDLHVETLKAAQWLKNNPSRNKKKNWRKYLTGWYGRANDTIENKKAFRSASSSGQGDRRTKNKDGTPIHSTAEGLF